MKKVTKKELVEKANEQEMRIFRIEQALKKSDIDLESLVGKNKFVCVESTNEDIQVGTFGSVTGFDERFHTNFSIDGRNWEYIADVDGNHLTIDAGDAWKAKFKRVDDPFADVKPEPKLKQLDQSVFSHPYVDDRFNYVALNADGQSIFFEQKPSVSVNLDIWVATGGSILPMLKGYDASNWQNSLIERKELTGSDLCTAMLERGDKFVMCHVGINKNITVITGWNGNGFTSVTNQDSLHLNPTPINNQGEPLTAAEVGL